MQILPATLADLRMALVHRISRIRELIVSAIPHGVAGNADQIKNKRNGKSRSLPEDSISGRTAAQSEIADLAKWPIAYDQELTPVTHLA
jgi:hypothetical protein